MNTDPSNPSSVPPQIPPAGIPDEESLPLGSDPTERVAIRNVLGVVEVVLRQPRRLMCQLREGPVTRLVGAMVLVTILCSVVYGVVVGAFSGGAQMWIAPLKVAGGLVISALICLPSLYIFACLSGSQARLGEVIGLLGGLVTLMTLLLVGFAPVAWLFSQSTQSIVWMGVLHLLVLGRGAFLRTPFPAQRFRAFQGAMDDRHSVLVGDLPAGGRSDDHGAPTAIGDCRDVLPGGEEVVSRPLERVYPFGGGPQRRQPAVAGSGNPDRKV